MPRLLIPLLLSVCLAAAADLDAPAQKPVTTRTEIERGMGALHDAPVIPSQFREYVDAVIKANEQKNTDTDAFRFGLYYLAWHNAWFTASEGFDDQLEQQMAELNSNIFFFFTTAARKRLGLSDADVQKVVNIYYVQNEDTLFPNIVESKKFKGTYPSIDAQLKAMQARQKAQPTP